MNPLAQRRWETFTRNRPAFVSLIIFGAFFCLSLCAEFIANDKPLLIRVNSGTEHHYYFPLFEELTEEELGGDLPLAVNYHNPAVQEYIEKHGWAIWPPVRYSYDTIPQDPHIVFPEKPGSRHWLGTDDLGRDILARILYGFRLSILFGLCLCLFGSVIGMAAGLAQGYYGGKLDLLFQRFMEIWDGIPVLYLIIIISSMIVIKFWVLLGIMLLFSWMHLVGVVRAESLRVRNMEYIRAARALGVSDVRIMFRHVLPNAMVALIAVMPFQINGSIVTLTSLDFLGFGLPSDYPSLGELIAQGKNNLYAPWIGITGFVTLGGMLSCLVLIGEGVRDALDPRVFFAHADDGDFPDDAAGEEEQTPPGQKFAEQTTTQADPKRPKQTGMQPESPADPEREQLPPKQAGTEHQYSALPGTEQQHSAIPGSGQPRGIFPRQERNR